MPFKDPIKRTEYQRNYKRKVAAELKKLRESQGKMEEKKA